MAWVTTAQHVASDRSRGQPAEQRAPVPYGGRSGRFRAETRMPMVVILEGRNWLPRRGGRAAAGRAVVVDAYPLMVGVVEAYARTSAQRLVQPALPRSGNTSAAVGRRARRERELQHPATHRRSSTSTRPPTSHVQCRLVRRNSSVRLIGVGNPPHRPRGQTRRTAANCPLAHGEGRPPPWRSSPGIQEMRRLQPNPWRKRCAASCRRDCNVDPRSAPTSDRTPRTGLGRRRMGRP